MFVKIKNIIFLIPFLVLVFLIIKYYFSKENIILINKSRSSYSLLLREDLNNLPILENDTNNIIVYKNDLEKFKKKRKVRFWEKLISNKNE